MGLKPLKTEMQIDSIDDDLRNGLWNQLDTHYWTPIKKEVGERRFLSYTRQGQFLFEKIWGDHFKFPLDTLPDYIPEAMKDVRERFFRFSWGEVYDFIEFVANTHPNENFIGGCNTILEREVSAYHFIGGKIIPVTAPEEIAEIEEALEIPLAGVRTHLETALKHFADRKNPDYRNSIKESISAVEAICKKISKKEKAELGDALKELEKKIKVHGALKSAFGSLYGYTSDGDGIRHALLEESTLDSEDAKFMLVSCSAFVNYLTVKAEKAGIRL